MKLRKALSLVLAGALCTGLLAGCGNGSTSTPAASTPAGSTPAASTPQHPQHLRRLRLLSELQA